MIYLKIYLIIALVCWFVFYGIEFAYWQKNWPLSSKEGYYEDMGDSFLLALLAAIIWPIGWMLEITKLGYGFKLK